MSWIVCVIDLPKDAQAVEDIPADFVPQPLGQRSQIIERILEVVPFANFSDPSWGFIETPDFVIEVIMGQAESVQSFSFRIRGGDAAIIVVDSLLAHLNLRAIDTSDGSIFEPEQAIHSLSAWRNYRSRVIGSESVRLP